MKTGDYMEIITKDFLSPVCALLLSFPFIENITMFIPFGVQMLILFNRWLFWRGISKAVGKI